MRSVSFFACAKFSAFLYTYERIEFQDGGSQADGVTD